MFPFAQLVRESPERLAVLEGASGHIISSRDVLKNRSSSHQYLFMIFIHLIFFFDE